MRGRPRKPTATLKLTGNYREDRRFADEPTPEVKIPDRPKWLTGEARREWDRIAPLLAAKKCLTEWDRSLMAAYCYEWGVYATLAKSLKAKDFVVKTSKGNEIQNPLLGARNKALKNLKELATEFGLSPCSRTRLSVGEQESANPFAALMKKKQA